MIPCFFDTPILQYNRYLDTLILQTISWFTLWKKWKNGELFIKGAFEWKNAWLVVREGGVRIRLCHPTSWTNIVYAKSATIWLSPQIPILSLSISLSLPTMNVLSLTHAHTPHANSLAHMHSISSLTQAQILTFSYLLQAYAHSLIRRISLNSTYMITSTLTHSHSLKFKLI